MSIRDKILKAEDIPSEIVDVPEWGVKLLMKGMASGEFIDFLNKIPRKDGKLDQKTLQAETVLAMSYDPDTGEKVFDPADRDMINQKSHLVLNRLMEVTNVLNGYTTRDEVVEDLKETPISETS